MPARRILLLGDPLLRTVSAPVASPASAATLLRDLEDTLAAFRDAHGFGRGISAIQIGVAARVIFLQVDGVRHELINPEFTWLSPDTFEMWDDCFSFPDLLVRLRRSQSVRLRYTTMEGEQKELMASGGLAELLQHEMDHLDGILAVDRALDRDSLALREEWNRRYSL
jgi:peptide deformylase